MSRTVVRGDSAREVVGDFAEWDIEAFTTTRAAGTYGINGSEPVSEVMGRWYATVDELRPTAPRFVTSRQIHGAQVRSHGSDWSGWLRAPDADGHFSHMRGVAMAVTIADCVPVFLAHESGAVALLHSGWRGTAADITGEGISLFERMGLSPREVRLHLGPAICGSCYEVSPDVFQRLTGREVSVPTTVDLRDIIARRAEERGVRAITVSPHCTRCSGDRFFSHRAGDSGRQIGVIVSRLA